ncbi:MAG: hypothetical protein K9H49_15575 [Bacteroidales bacterium]|nr:hypothetical protein [Bacteroidales bacterium]MCF8405488.1 hypothetical protein [Bacteroidales bacterium]
MKGAILIISIFIGMSQALSGQAHDLSKNSHALLFMAGGRYDNLRMCVGSPAGVKGGPMADVMFITKHKLNESYSLTFNLPVMRPILFGMAFKMLQFEPEITLKYNLLVSEKIDFVSGPGVGISFHYGPDYLSDLTNRGPSFFAMGPFLSWQTGFAFKKENLVKNFAGIKGFYVPLFAKGRSAGTVLGGALLYSYYF